jgi:hypothetical protein
MKEVNAKPENPDRVDANDNNVITSGEDIRVDDLLTGAVDFKLTESESPKEPPTPMRKVTQEELLEGATGHLKIDIGGHVLSADQILSAAAALQQQVVRDAQGKKLDLNAAAQVMNIKNLKTKDGKLDFDNMTEEAAYDLDIPIIAKPFSNEDALDVDLKDKSYVPRWVNVNPMRLGSMRSRGFIFIVEEDLAKPLNMDIEVDAQGHYRCNDVVLMRITKDRYFAALRAGFMRANAAVSALGAHKAATNVATQYMEKETSGDFVEYANRGKIKFYQTVS